MRVATKGAKGVKGRKGRGRGHADALPLLLLAAALHLPLVSAERCVVHED
jgi:hypothetical protein